MNRVRGGYVSCFILNERAVFLPKASSLFVVLEIAAIPIANSGNSRYLLNGTRVSLVRLFLFEAEFFK